MGYIKSPILGRPGESSWEPSQAKPNHLEQNPNAPSWFCFSYSTLFHHSLAQFFGQITMEVAPSKMPSIIRHTRFPMMLDTIVEDDNEAMGSSRSPQSKNCSKEVCDASVCCADKRVFLAPMEKVESLKIKA
ncbi:hypothetical protein GUJ93_ZPchr0008g12327 [Zizania palustris]|uniref:Uncharacterized protein n=1 Tax=Zizania palustris TaxID=103762 RepID=A0A8J5VJK1_ZIZPA|nr:hypothetical protein GUJ93_ZPchr0008g12327 [Zizania palustris]